MAQRECVSGGGTAQLACRETRASLSVTRTHTCAAPRLPRACLTPTEEGLCPWSLLAPRPLPIGPAQSGDY